MRHFTTQVVEDVSSDIDLQLVPRATRVIVSKPVEAVLRIDASKLVCSPVLLAWTQQSAGFGGSLFRVAEKSEGAWEGGLVKAWPEFFLACFCIGFCSLGVQRSGLRVQSFGSGRCCPA